MHKYTSIFPHYGGKSKCAHVYPKPSHDLIVESFAGAAAYALRYCDHDVLLFDVNPITAAVWRFLLSPGAMDWVERIPDNVEPGFNVGAMFDDAPYGMVEFLSANANLGTLGGRSRCKIVTQFGAQWWHMIKPRSRYWIPRIAHWKFHEASYETASDVVATWFVDPPYASDAGRKYAYSDIDYTKLASWCANRRGQVIVCENAGASWLPFRRVAGYQGIRSRYQKSDAAEAMWHVPDAYWARMLD